MNQELKEIIREIKFKRSINQSQIATELGVKATYLSDAINGRVPYSNSLRKKLYELYSDCLTFTSEKEMIISHNENESPKEKDIPIMRADKKRIPFYDDVTTVGGNNRLVADVPINGSVSEWIDAGDWFPEATAAIRHYGDSMIEYPSGCILALKRVDDWRLIIWGKNYVIETTEFRITKQLQDGGADYIMAYSSNQSTYPDGTLIHSPIKIPKETIRHIDLVLGCVTKEFSNGAVRIVNNR